ncbi:Anaerobic nitric oxide reductase transcription regulator NorR [bioreactor metagenome]|uniref:Anaerobic nitric oxide reductase transcription regulator NorR n=1 Tax=bioreactor metagenome TaxID=1076179 RepID=A0A644X1I3_9ZZZZ
MADTEKWENLHMGGYANDLPEYVAKAWHTSYALDVDPEKTDVTMYDINQFAKMKEAFTEVFLYAHRAAKSYYNNILGKDICIGLFDRNCCMMHLYGSGNALQKNLTERNLTRKSKWDYSTLGANAVSVGFELNRPVTIKGYQNFCRLLSDFSTAFTPFSIESKFKWPGDKENTNEVHTIKGGVALFYRMPEDREVCETISFSIVREISTYLHLLYITYQLLSANRSAILVINVDAKGTYSIFDYNARIFKSLGIPAKVMFNKRLDSIIDPKPNNKEFWDMIQSGVSKKNINMELKIHGISNSYIVTLLPDSEESLQIQNITIAIDSEKQINRAISQKIGNNARLTFCDIIGENPTFLHTVEQAKLTAKSDRNVLILGESGTGKDIFAQAIHNASDRKNNPFIAMNCAALPRELIASELFGYTEGAFTGAKRGGNVGKVELANSGTLFLDEIADLPLDLQAMLLRILENSAFMRLGATRETSVDVKIISATNANIIEMINQKKFRADLYYRLSTLQLMIPPLRERGQDTILLAEHFFKLNALRFGNPPVTLSEGAKEMLMKSEWKGNVRSLQNMVESLALLHPGETITREHIEEYMNSTFGRFTDSAKTDGASNIETVKNSVSYYRKMPKEVLLKVLEKNRFNKTVTAHSLGISRKTLYRWMLEYGLEL